MLGRTLAALVAGCVVLVVGLAGIMPVRPAAADLRPLEIVGWKESVRIPAYGVTLEAKMDTGADSSSLHAENIESFEKNGDTWVRFKLVTHEQRDRPSIPDDELDQRTIDASAKVVDVIRLESRRKEPYRRYVISLGLCVDHVYREVDVNLSDRSGYSTRMLVGRNYLEGYFLIDSSLEFTREPVCQTGGD